MVYLFATIFMGLVVLSAFRFQYKGESLVSLAFALGTLYLWWYFGYLLFVPENMSMLEVVRYYTPSYQTIVAYFVAGGITAVVWLCMAVTVVGKNVRQYVNLIATNPADFLNLFNYKRPILQLSSVFILGSRQGESGSYTLSAINDTARSRIQAWCRDNSVSWCNSRDENGGLRQTFFLGKDAITLEQAIAIGKEQVVKAYEPRIADYSADIAYVLLFWPFALLNLVLYRIENLADLVRMLCRFVRAACSLLFSPLTMLFRRIYDSAVK